MLEGDLDIATIPALRERLLSVLVPGMRPRIIDLSGVSFCGVAALAMLIVWADIARRLAECTYGDALSPDFPRGHGLH
jgi:anti-anti-sigma regulatory factor